MAQERKIIFKKSPICIDLKKNGTLKITGVSSDAFLNCRARYWWPIGIGHQWVHEFIICQLVKWNTFRNWYVLPLQKSFVLNICEQFCDTRISEIHRHQLHHQQHLPGFKCWSLKLTTRPWNLFFFPFTEQQKKQSWSSTSAKNKKVQVAITQSNTAIAKTDDDR